MSEKDGYSPSFKRPADIMRMRRRKRGRSEASSSPAQRASSPACVRPFSPGPLLGRSAGGGGGGGGSVGGGGVKRRNPFADIENTLNSAKRRLVVSKDEAEEEDVAVNGRSMEEPEEQEGGEDMVSTKTESSSRQRLDFTLMDAETPHTKKPVSFTEDDSLFDEDEEEMKAPVLQSPQVSDPAPIVPPVCEEYPADWSLKTRVLFTSQLPFSWAEQPRAQEEAAGLTQQCRALYTTLPHSIQDPRSCSELRCAFQQSLVYWQHPSLPWLSLFPRINAERSFAGKSAPWAQDAALQQSLMSEWSASLSSLYSLLKCRMCPYFYLCSYQFTVLFKAAGFCGSSSITALISPTTRGLREAMKADGIEFSLPLVEEKRRSRGQQGSSTQHGEDDDTELLKSKEVEDCAANEEEDDADEDDMESGFSWLEEMGIQDKIKKPDSISIQLRKEHSSVCVDHKPESVVQVEGAHTFTLINFLINCKSLVAAAGSQAGLPPTLLAPTAFRGATMHTLKARSVNVKTQVRSTYQDVCSLEITGPILPSCLHVITRLLTSAQRGGFSAALYTHTPTAVMNTHTKQCDSGTVSGTVDVCGCGLHPDSIKQLQQSTSLGKSALRHLHMDNYNYTWDT